MQVTRIDFGDGTTRKLRFTFGAMAHVEDESGLSLTDLISSRAFSGIRWIVYGAIRKGGGKPVTLDKTGDLIDTWMESRTLDALTEIVIDGLSEAGVWKIPSDDDEGGEKADSGNE